MLALLDGESVVALDIASLSKEETETFTADELDLFAGNYYYVLTAFLLFLSLSPSPSAFSFCLFDLFETN